MPCNDDKVIAKALQRLHGVYGNRLAMVTLFGSRSRNQARANSDYDIALFVDNLISPLEELDCLVDLSWAIQKLTGTIVSFKAFDVGEYEKPNVLLQEIRSKGIRLWTRQQ